MGLNMVNVKLRNVTKRFEDVVAVDHVNLDVKHGEFIVLVGPSGCGKTTLLRCIAGLEVVDEGRIYFDDEDITDLPPYKRGTGMVFQNYALWPHMTVYDNIAYGLRIRKLPKREIDRRVRWALKLVKLEGLEKRYPTQLSGGQQQRVALARALVVEPKVLLLDEPLSNLDAKLRVEMREEIKKLQRQLGITTIYVTHDQEEAMTIADRMAVMNKGRILQVGRPDEVYRNPKNIFVASFLGRCTILWGKVLEVEGEIVKVLYGEKTLIGRIPSKELKVDVKEKVALVVRPEDVLLEKPDTDKINVLEGVVDWISYVGDRKDLRVKVCTDRILSTVNPDVMVKPGNNVKVYIKYEDLLVLPVKSLEELAYAKEMGLIK